MNFLVEKCFLFISSCKMKFHHCHLLPGEMTLATTWKKSTIPPWKKSFRRPWLYV